ncbi:penicillin-binding protein [Anaerobacillus arseniciselenatis]|uniref:Penicillin-binding protein n=1 Tax=Anaerobacillus arseniciselenatis TaxID=85682 RepID=A0A1S2LTH4_9BACI|nr:PBP1A family penicillin-binding protein [Anaerobacillus arseniciselenatis]OIJ15808.1 penicillin-binding protein [Anaerobacillus arseniciselenatis]
MSEDTRTRQGRRKQKQTTSKQTGTKKAAFKKVFVVFLIAFAFAIVAGGFTVYSIIKDAPPLDPDKLTLALNPEILDENGEVFTRLDASENRRKVTINDVPRLVEDAFIAVEDVRFREHFGIDIRRIGGAVRANVTGGFGAEGASTITQQVVKNLFLTNEKLLTRKIQEQYLAIKLEQAYSKDQILEMYLNAIYFSGAYGVAEAADRYFSKTLDELTIEDAALLAGIPQRPNHFNPLRNPEAAETRRNTVISLMERHGKITANEATQARAVSVQDQLNPSKAESYPYPDFLDQVLTEVAAIEGITSSDIYTSGLKIYTTLNQDAQTYTENLFQNYDFPDEEFQAGLTIVDTKTGEIKAIVGSRENDGVKLGTNYAIHEKRSPGSTIKPILDYGPAIEHFKWSTYHQIVDEPHTYSNGDPFRNFGDNYEHGPMSMRRALALSRNVPAVKAFQEVGAEKAKSFGEGLGLSLDNIQESYSIGGFTHGLSTDEVAGAYAAFGNGGVYNKPYTVRKVEFPDGRIIDLTPDSQIAMSDYTAYMISDMLKTAVGPFGTGRNARVEGLPMAGKTGTSNGTVDRWFAGYTTDYSIAVWTGYKDRREITNTQIVLDLFKQVMREVSKGKETADFKQPNSVVKVGIERSSGLLPSEFTSTDEIIYEYFVRGNEPTKVSEQFMKPDKPTEFMGSYNEITDQIILSWAYPENEREEFSFELQLSVNNEEFEIISFSDEMQHIIFNPESDSTYHFKLRAVSDLNNEVRSDPVELKVEIPDKGIEDDEIDEDTESETPIEIPNPLDDLDEIIGGSDDDNEDDEDEIDGDNDAPNGENNENGETETS